MGKVFDALQRAEEQRARRASEARTGALPAVESGPAPVPRGRAPRAGMPFWRRWLRRSRRVQVDDVGALNKRRIALLQPQSFVAEQFRSLRARLDSLASAHPLRTIVVTSADPGDGKSTAAINLALVMAMSVGRKVVLVDCDLRNPSIHESLGLRVDAGLAEVLLGSAELEESLVQVEGSSLLALPVRGVPHNPAELLASGRMREVVEKLTARFDCVVLDVPPVLGLPDAKIVSEFCDGILLVVRAHATPQTDVESALEVVDRSRVLGVVLNDADAGADRYGNV
jgi:capsular exopolysaccharide synthesis family protein